MNERRRYVFIVLVSILMAAGVWVVGELVGLARGEGDPVATEGHATTAPLARQEGQFRSLQSPLRPAATPTGSDGVRDLETYYSRRAYEGAPPFIPHPVDPALKGSRGCASCHEFGGWSPTFQAEAPRTPHPELVACRQCHVERNVETLFRPTVWERPVPAGLGRAALPGSPPPMPHALQMRENCLACHSGPSVPDLLRTTHPERAGCLQCHVPQEADGTWARASVDEGGG